MLLAGLPEESALRSELRGRPWSEVWRVEHELMAQAVDALNVVATEYRRQGKPGVVPRPGELRRARASSPEEIAAFFGAEVTG